MTSRRLMKLFVPRAVVGLVMVVLMVGTVTEGFSQGPPSPQPLPVAVESDAFAPGHAPWRFGPLTYGILPGDGIPLIGFEVVPPVEPGQTFILTHLHAVLFSNNSGIPIVDGGCQLILRTPGGLYTPFMTVPLEEDFAGTFESFLPLNEGEGINVLCVSPTATEMMVSQGFRATAVGYFVPAAP